MMASLVAAVLLVAVLHSSAAEAARHPLPAFSRFSLPPPTPQSPEVWQQHMQGVSNAAAAAAARNQQSSSQQHSTPTLPRTDPPSLLSTGPTTAVSAAMRKLQQQNSTAAPGSSSTAASGAGNVSSGEPAGPANPVITVCPAWAPDAATASGMLLVNSTNSTANNSSSSSIPVEFTADFNELGSGGVTAADRAAALSAAAGAAIAAASGNASSSAASNASSVEAPVVAFAPGLFDRLSVEEMLAVYSFLFSVRELNLTPIEAATNNDNYVAWLELAPPDKAAALAWLDQQDSLAAQQQQQQQPEEELLTQPDRVALAMVIEGRHNPPRVVQLSVGPLPSPAAWRYIPLGPSGQMEAGWLQRPYSLPEATSVGLLMAATAAPLIPLMKQAYEGWWFDPQGSACNTTCLTYSLGAPFGAGAALPAGTPVGTATGSGSSSASQRWLWSFFYRNLEGHHLHTVGLEVQLDVSAADPADWKAGQVWFGGTLWPSIGELLAAWNSTAPANNTGSGGGVAADAAAAGVDPAKLEQLRSFKLPTPSASDALLSTFVPRGPAAGAPHAPSPGSGDTGAAGGGDMSGPPLQYEPGGRRFRLGVSGLDSWMGWSLVLGHRPTSGLSFWDIRFRGERVVYELSLQEAFAGYGGPSPMQAHTQYLDSHWGLGSAYKELVAGVDCPLSAAYMDLSYSFGSGPLTQRNAVCVFELSLGQPLLRHWADSGGGPAYYGAMPGSVLVVRAISAVYNYDYIQDLRLHLDASIEVSVHTSGYVQSSLYSRASQGDSYGYPFWHTNSGTIHDHLLHWKVDVDVGGTPNSIRLDQVLLEQRGNDEGFTGAGPWYSKRVAQQFPATEAAATLYCNGSSKADPTAPAPPTFFYIINKNSTNRWGSARGYRLQHTLDVPQVLPPAEVFGNSRAVAWSKYKVAVTARREAEGSSSSPLNQPLPFAPAVDFDTLLQASGTQQPAATAAGGAAEPKAQAAAGESQASSAGDDIQQQDLVLWVTSGLQHLPGSEDAPVTPATGPAIGFWLRPFNFFDESAAASQPGMVYIPALTQPAASSASGPAGGGGHQGPAGLPQPGLGMDDTRGPVLTDPAALTAARRGFQPYVGVALTQQCLPFWPSVPFNGSYAPILSAPFLAAALGPDAAGANVTSSANSTTNSTTGSRGG